MPERFDPNNGEEDRIEQLSEGLGQRGLLEEVVAVRTLQFEAEEDEPVTPQQSLRETLLDTKWTRQAVGKVILERCNVDLQQLIENDGFTFGVTKNNGREVRIEQLIAILEQRGVVFAPRPVVFDDDVIEGYGRVQNKECSGYLGGVIAEEDWSSDKIFQLIIKLIKDTRQNRHTLILCPTPLCERWQRELQRFAPELSSHIYRGLADFDQLDADCIISDHAAGVSLVTEKWYRVVLDVNDIQASAWTQEMAPGYRWCIHREPIRNEPEVVKTLCGFLGDFALQRWNSVTTSDDNTPVETMLSKIVLRRTSQAPSRQTLTEQVSPILQREFGLTLEELINARTNPFVFGVARNNGKEVRIEQLIEMIGQRGLLEDVEEAHV